MTQVIRWLAPGEIETDLSPRVDNGNEPRTVLTSFASELSVGTCSILLRDPLGDFFLTGLNRIDVAETDSISDDPYIWVGRCFDRVERRGRYRTGRGRDIEVTLEDMNQTASRYIIGSTEDGNRDAEDHADRIAWLLTTEACALLTDTSLVLTTTSVAMPAYDYSGMTPQQVIDDCARASGYQNFIWYNGVTDELGLVYAESDGDWLDSGLRLSNVISEVEDDETGMTVYLGATGEQRWDPSRVASHIYARGDGIDTFRELDATADLFGRTDHAMDFATVKVLATLEARVDRSLASDLNTETNRVKGTVYLPSTLASLFKAGYRFELHATHLTGFQDEFAPLRLVETTHTLLTPILYQIEFEAEPLEATPEPGACAEGATPSGTYEPRNSETAEAGDIAFYARAGLPDPVIGSGYAGDWHFGEMGTAGSPDVAGYLAGNILLVGVRGAGTLTVDTVVVGGSTSVAWETGAGLFGLDPTPDIASGTIAAGDSLEVTFDTNDGEFCEHWLKMSFQGATGVKVGYAGAVWVSTEV